MYKCSQCGNRFPVAQIRYSVNGKDIFCTGCYEKSLKLGSPQVKAGSFREYAEKVFEQRPVQTLHYICKDCKYSFSLKKGSHIAIRCPYCGRENVVERKDVSADQLLKESDDPRYSPE